MTHLRVNKSTTDKKSTIKTVNCYPFKKMKSLIYDLLKYPLIPILHKIERRAQLFPLFPAAEHLVS